MQRSQLVCVSIRYATLYVLVLLLVTRICLEWVQYDIWEFSLPVQESLDVLYITQSALSIVQYILFLEKLID